VSVVVRHKRALVGLNATLSVITRKEFRKYPHTNPAVVAEFDLWKGWGPLESALQTMLPPLNLTFRGNRPTVEEFEDDWDAYDAFVTPALVRRISAALAGVCGEELIAALKSVGFAHRKREHPEHLAAFETLRAAYREAAKRDAYLRIFIC
jgi:hypothetical protein